MASYKPIIGLEIHVQLNTKTKLFCSCYNEYSPDEPNKNICPFCTGQPGALPVLNKEAVKKAIIFGTALGSNIPEKTRWDRKNYFYPDLPTGYQISQYDNPIVEGGKLSFYIEDKTNGNFESTEVVLTRAHLEADAAKLLHANSKTFVDFNRSGAPLIEIVTEPMIRSGSQAMAFVSELQLLVRRLGISDADMDKGQMRFDCNLSLQNDEQQKTDSLPSYRTETKNINSIRSLGRAIEYEIKRQTELLEKGERPVQETRGWKDDLNKSTSQRSKEEAMDYRYFPEPDLRILEISSIDKPLFSNLPELPATQRSRYLKLGLSHQIANTLIAQVEVGSFFDHTTDQLSDSKTIKTIANIISGPLIALSAKTEKKIDAIATSENLIILASLFEQGKINNQGLLAALEILSTSINSNMFDILETHQLIQVSDDNALQKIVDAVILSNKSVVVEYQLGKTQVIGFLIGQCMKESKGAGNPKKFTDILLANLTK
ncbi:MAG: Asp-tRNA(Asn)/Glu-tRNA(Gln) amidotransferase subunit GatB [candidate division SR1 bacterium]|nr:Asp-tRNA(Asn)/Glu-tRNA(Gln) amidotransferase subunit GatB [candidate division SR1 bacterium]